MPFPFLPSMRNRGGASARRRQPDSGVLGLGGGRERGGRGREVLWWGSRPHLGLGWRAEAGRCEPAAAGGNGCGGGATGLDRRLGPAGEVMGMAVELGGPFIAGLRQWSGAGR